MKKILLFICLGLFMIGCVEPSQHVDADIDPEMTAPTFNYRFKVWDTEIQIYEFTTTVDPNVHCVVSTLRSNKAMGLQCFRVGPIAVINTGFDKGFKMGNESDSVPPLPLP
jgi:hypothetical protein